jgi:DNA invertase Pin-like site-specific DNA recombinase
MPYDFARVATDCQSADAHVCQHRAAGAGHVSRGTARGAHADRAQLRRVLGQLAAGDVVTATRLDWLVRSTFDLLAIGKRIVAAGGQFRSLAEPRADKAASAGRPMVAVLGGLANLEHELIRTRAVEGRSRAEACGQHMGRPPKLTPEPRKEARRRRAEGATLKELARSYNGGRETISRLSA